MATDKLVDFDHVTDYISREAAWNGIYSCPTKTDADGYIWVRTKDVAHMIDEIPAADVRPVVKAEWVECDWCVPSHGFVEHYKNAAWKCTNCKHAFKKQDLFVRNFCPNCGADMRGPNLDATKGDNHD